MKASERLKRVIVLKRVLRELAHLPRTPVLQADMATLEAWIVELGGDARNSVHVAIRKGKDRSET